MTKNKMNFEFEKKIYTELQKAIVRTVVYFDLFDYPLTDFEVWRFLLTLNNPAKRDQVTLSEVAQILENKVLEAIKTKNGFYFLKDREHIIRTRLERYNFTDRKVKRALKVAKIYQLIPWVKIIAVSNIIGAHNLKDESDIDFFIVTEKNKIWLTRFFCVGIAKMLGLRPSEKNSCDKICLNFFVSEEAMDLRKLMLKGVKPPIRGLTPLPDIYFIYWLANLIVIYDKGGMYKKFIQANGWLKSYLPNWQEIKMVSRRFGGERKNLFFNLFFNFIFSPFEELFKRIQLRMLPLQIKELINKDTRVVTNDNVLKLHTKDRREEYRKNYELRIKNYE